MEEQPNWRLARDEGGSRPMPEAWWCPPVSRLVSSEGEGGGSPIPGDWGCPPDSSLLLGERGEVWS